MDFQRPIEAVIPGVQGRILAVLAETSAELNLRTIARLARVSPAQASRVLPALVELGLVERREAPPSALFSLVADHVAVRAVRALGKASEMVLRELGMLANQIEPAPVSVIVFGSFARGQADAQSDLDVVLVRSALVGEDDARWVESEDAWRRAVRRLTGNRLQVLEVDEIEIARRLRRPSGVWADVLREGIVLAGKAPRELRSQRSA